MSERETLIQILGNGRFEILDLSTCVGGIGDELTYINIVGRIKKDEGIGLNQQVRSVSGDGRRRGTESDT